MIDDDEPALETPRNKMPVDEGIKTRFRHDRAYLVYKAQKARKDRKNSGEQ